MVRWITLLITAAVASLFLYAFWLRTTSLETLPELNGDEVWRSVQLTRLLKGEPYSLMTVSSLPLSPVSAALELPLLLVFKPSLWVVRLPAVITGIMAVALLYILGSRMLDRTTALIAAALLAAMPVAIIFSRVSYENSHAALYGILIVYFAHRLNIVAVVFMLLISYFVHPTNIFILPILLAIILVQSLKQIPEDPARAWRRLLARLAAPTGAVLAVGLLAMQSPDTERLSKAFDTGLGGRHDFLEFWVNYERLILGCHTDSVPLRSWLFWTVLFTTLGFGMWRLISARRWDRVALVVGTIVSALGLFVMGGSNIIMPSASRYGLFLVTPTCLGVACLVNSLLVNRESVRFAWVRSLQYGGMLALGWIMLLSIDLTHITKWSFMAPGYHNDKESPWTFGTDARPPLRQLSSLIVHDLEARNRLRPSLAVGKPQSAAQPTEVLVADFWVFGPLEWLTIPRPEIKIVNFDRLPPKDEDRFAIVKENLERGGYLISFEQNPGPAHVVQRLFPAESLKRWEIPQTDGQPYLSLYRLKWDVLAAHRKNEGGSAAAPQLGRLEPPASPGADGRTIQ